MLLYRPNSWLKLFRRFNRRFRRKFSNPCWPHFAHLQFQLLVKVFLPQSCRSCSTFRFRWFASTVVFNVCFGFTAFGFLGSVPSIASSTAVISTLSPVASQGIASSGTSTSLVVPTVVPMFSAASFLFTSTSSFPTYSLPASIIFPFASRLIASHAAVPSALPCQQAFAVGPGYSPVPLKVVSEITAGKFLNPEDLFLQQARTSTVVRWPLSIIPHAQKPKRQIKNTASWMEAFSIFYLSYSLLIFPAPLASSFVFYEHIVNLVVFVS